MASPPGSTPSQARGATSLKQQVGGQIGRLASKGAAKVNDLAEARKEAAAQKLDGVVEVVREFADAAEQRFGTVAGDAVNRGGDAIETAVAELRRRSVEDVVDQTRSFIVRHPGISLGAASVVGFVAGRIAKAGLTQPPAGQPVGEAA